MNDIKNRYEIMYRDFMIDGMGPLAAMGKARNILASEIDIGDSDRLMYFTEDNEDSGMDRDKAYNSAVRSLQHEYLEELINPAPVPEPKKSSVDNIYFATGNVVSYHGSLWIVGKFDKRFTHPVTKEVYPTVQLLSMTSSNFSSGANREELLEVERVANDVSEYIKARWLLPSFSELF